MIVSINGLFVFDHINPGLELIYMVVSFIVYELGQFFSFF